MVCNEAKRMIRDTRMPARLQELFRVLDDDPVLFQECLARPLLTDRLVRNFFAFDQRIHEQTRADALSIRESLESGQIDPYSVHPARTVVDIVRMADGSGGGPTDEGRTIDGVRRVAVTEAEFSAWRARLPAAVGQVGSVQEQRDRFVFSVLLDEAPDALQVANFAFSKTSWDAWWMQVSENIDSESATSVAGGCLEEEPDFPSAVADLQDDTWDNGVLDKVPDPRVRPTAVWTGTEMLVWGGRDGDGDPVGTGDRYNPTTDTWTPITMVNAPEARKYHSAVWTGDRMIVWGGDDGVTSFDSGGIYDPTTDAWTPTGMNGVPDGRELHSAVWTGSQMVIWSGVNSTGHLQTGGRFSPAEDTWTATSTIDAPDPRRAHTAVWTGNEMIVWGGIGEPNSGGRYDPQTDVWSPVSSVNIPHIESWHTAVWTGDEMIVWGGDSPGVSDPTIGGRYNPVSSRRWGAL
jgi:hypothetical protein